MTIFDAQSIHQAVLDTLSAVDIPPDHRNAFALVGRSDGTVNAVLATKLSNVWTVEATFAVAPGQKPEAGVMIKATW